MTSSPSLPCRDHWSPELPLDLSYCRKTPKVSWSAAPVKMAAELHPRSGKLIGLSNSNRTAQRNQPVQEFNHGLVLSREPLRDRDVFTVRIDKKVNKFASSGYGSCRRFVCSTGLNTKLFAAHYRSALRREGYPVLDYFLGTSFLPFFHVGTKLSTEFNQSR